MKTHKIKGQRSFSRGTFRPLCAPDTHLDYSKNPFTYGVDDVTCKACLEALIKQKEKEISIIKEYIKFAG